MITDLTISINNGKLRANYIKNSVKYVFNIDGFILPKGKELNKYILNKIKEDEKTINPTVILIRL